VKLGEKKELKSTTIEDGEFEDGGIDYDEWASVCG